MKTSEALCDHMPNQKESDTKHWNDQRKLKVRQDGIQQDLSLARRSTEWYFLLGLHGTWYERCEFVCSMSDISSVACLSCERRKSDRTYCQRIG
jgi:hypothetical protein